MKKILSKFLGQTIGVNISGTAHINDVVLKSVQSDCFSVYHLDDGNLYHIPFTHVAHVAENADGVKEGKFLFRMATDLPVFVRLGPVVDYVSG